MKILKYLQFIFILLIFEGCESLEDTYDKYAGSGTIRYLGKCKDLSVSPGWKRLIVTWTNHVDPAISQIKVSWTLDGVTRDTLLTKETTKCNIPNLENGTYEIAVCGIDKDGNCSLPVFAYERPYTLNHENILSFTRLFTKYFFVRNRLAIIWDEWHSNIESATLNYYSEGKLISLELDSVFITDNKYFLLPDNVDQDSKVTINRSGRLPDCTDLIIFEPYELTRKDKIYSPDFKQLFNVLGYSDITENIANSITNLEIDYNLETFEDILNFPQLQTLILGKNRYIANAYLSLYNAASQVSDMEGSIFALKVAHEVCGLEVFRYNKHYFPDGALSFIKNLSNPEIPDFIYLDTKDWTYTCSHEEAGEGFENLFIELPSTSYWQTAGHEGTPYTIELTADMQTSQSIKGIQITQRNITTTSYVKRFAQKIQIKVSSDNKIWKDATHVIENTLGNTGGETTIIHFPNTLNARYLKFIVKEQVYNSVGWASVSLGKIQVF